MARQKRTDPAPPAWLREGVRVDYSAVIGEPPTQRNLVVLAGPDMADSGHWVAWLEGKPGCVSIDALQPASVNDDQIRAYRDDHRAAGDIEIARCCNAALGIPTGDGAMGLLDATACRARIALRICADSRYTLDAVANRVVRP